jgi:hypothetical protein
LGSPPRDVIRGELEDGRPRTMQSHDSGMDETKRPRLRSAALVSSEYLPYSLRLTSQMTLPILAEPILFCYFCIATMLRCHNKRFFGCAQNHPPLWWRKKSDPTRDYFDLNVGSAIRCWSVWQVICWCHTTATSTKEQESDTPTCSKVAVAVHSRGSDSRGGHSPPRANQQQIAPTVCLMEQIIIHP